MPPRAACLLFSLFLIILGCISRARGLADTAGWLEGHNRRRAHFHAKYGKQYVPLHWSGDLANGAADYAAYLVANNCAFRHCRSSFSNGEEDCDFGENLAMNWGWGGPRPVDDVLTAWTEEEESSMGGHYTQVLWRATRYVGCGSASGTCGHIQVCRYLRPGNCNGLYRYLEDDSPCGPMCPAEGCFAEGEGAQQHSFPEEPSHSSPSTPTATTPTTSAAMSISVVPPTTTTTAPPPPNFPASSMAAEIFEANSEFDLAYTTLRFDAGNDYAACRSPSWQFPVDTSDGRVLSLGDDDETTIVFEDGFRFPYFGESYSTVYVSSNGFVEFVDSNRATHSPAFGRHYNSPKISALFTDLVPQVPGSRVSWKQVGRELVAITFHNVPTYGEENNRNSFQLILHASGDIEIAYLAVNGRKRRLVGLSAGHLPPLLQSVDLSQHSICEADANAGSSTAMECILGAQTFKFEPTEAWGQGLRALCVDSSDPSIIIAELKCESEYITTHSEGRIVTTCAET